MLIHFVLRARMPTHWTSTLWQAIGFFILNPRSGDKTVVQPCMVVHQYLKQERDDHPATDDQNHHHFQGWSFKAPSRIWFVLSMVIGKTKTTGEPAISITSLLSNQQIYHIFRARLTNQANHFPLTVDQLTALQLFLWEGPDTWTHLKGNDYSNDKSWRTENESWIVRGFSRRLWWLTGFLTTTTSSPGRQIDNNSGNTQGSSPNERGY